MATIELSSGTVHYRVAGPEESAAPPVVFVHAFLTDSRLWSRVADDLAERGIRSYAPDWPLGAHPSAMKADADLSPRGVARLVLEFLDTLGLDEVTLVGNDTGGALCQFAVDEDPRRIGRLVLSNCEGLDVFPPAMFAPLFALLRSERRVRFLAGQMRVRALRQSWLGFGLLAHDLPADLTRSWIEPALSDDGVVRDLVRFLRAVDSDELLDVSTRLDRFAGPVTLAWGTDDRAFTTKLGRRLQQCFRDAAFVPVPKSRTFVPLDAPRRLADEIVAIVARPRVRNERTNGAHGR
ncbi:alpha/beta fold hydrolase [Jiangella mangrovi]|uniref:Pimeloyl-ACP methyl ester carboxylesterase n=1 Tax=Jiangella mangrovi TaxID=1524084 RepID=A0A7W9GPR6_9ACTN|nr:alpha/beta fold hydrolase [Jiangella mangrovi]MBB5787787.1 pimeloyl-ACP methyl ester carboxylesterase [Jiangella mangrovi]